MRHQTTLKFIDAIARAGSIRRAAETMAITPSALNRRLLAVEQELDAPLFERMAVGVRLSAAGELFLAHARRQLADFDRVRSHIEDMKGARRGHISIGFNAGMVADGFGEALQIYQGEHDAVSFEIHQMTRPDIVDALIEYQIDLGVVIQASQHPALTTLATAPLDICAVMHPSHALAEQRCVTFNELLSYPLILPPNGSLRHFLNVSARRQGYELRPDIEAELQFAGATLAKGKAIGFQINTATRTEIALPQMIGIPISRRDLPQPFLHLLQLRGRALSVAAGRFADMLTQRFARYSGEI